MIPPDCEPLCPLDEPAPLAATNANRIEDAAIAACDVVRRMDIRVMLCVSISGTGATITVDLVEFRRVCAGQRVLRRKVGFHDVMEYHIGSVTIEAHEWRPARAAEQSDWEVLP